ncbi:IclR family transcriptional regulator [Arthrobacter cupressi]|uniref:Transcriptional regulator, IclR family n=1 Tax=Arthrobacter cupressi TaxID=1045773 RepID=A0A1G8R5I0_9MICC|nr:IclR family transcriptional regulator [Arthrobacter cupressi]NYD77842.1 DNA-binding IclR family transcriptional regulator [Arthrobacter cupressi]SDJ12188.1 transcriptional regulator, IclR family [Arthrobacter cupressi]
MATGGDGQVTEEHAGLINKSVVKATVILGELGRHRQGITVTELAQAVGITRPTAFRLLLSLEQTGFVARSDNRYALGWQMARLGRLADPYSGLVPRVQPILDEYAATFGETLTFMMPTGETSYDVVAEASPSRFLNASHMWVGGSYPMHASAAGKVILAERSDEQVLASLPKRLESYTPKTITSRSALLKELRRVREKGFAILDDELEEGLYVVACPVRDSAGKLLGVLALNGPSQRVKAEDAGSLAARLQAAADKVAGALT